MEAIIKEFNEFKEENHLSNDCIQVIQDEEGNILSLTITMPTLALYDKFIQQLANNLLPAPNHEIQEKDESRKEQSLTPNPLSMEPKPSFSKEEDSEDNEINATKQDLFNPSPFSTKLKLK